MQSFLIRTIGFFIIANSTFSVNSYSLKPQEYFLIKGRKSYFITSASFLPYYPDGTIGSKKQCKEDNHYIFKCALKDHEKMMGAYTTINFLDLYNKPRTCKFMYSNYGSSKIGSICLNKDGEGFKVPAEILKFHKKMVVGFGLVNLLEGYPLIYRPIPLQENELLPNQAKLPDYEYLEAKTNEGSELPLLTPDNYYTTLFSKFRIISESTGTIKLQTAFFQPYFLNNNSIHKEDKQDQTHIECQDPQNGQIECGIANPLIRIIGATATVEFTDNDEPKICKFNFFQLDAEGTGVGSICMNDPKYGAYPSLIQQFNDRGYREVIPAVSIRYAIDVRPSTQMNHNPSSSSSSSSHH